MTSGGSALSAASQLSSIKGLLDTVKSSSAQFDALSPGVQDQLKQLFAGQLGPLKTQFADQLSRLEGKTMYAGIATMLKEVSLP